MQTVSDIFVNSLHPEDVICNYWKISFQVDGSTIFQGWSIHILWEHVRALWANSTRKCPSRPSNIGTEWHQKKAQILNQEPLQLRGLVKIYVSCIQIVFMFCSAVKRLITCNINNIIKVLKLWFYPVFEKQYWTHFSTLLATYTWATLTNMKKQIIVYTCVTSE